jgi:hypothetical protein
MCIEAQARMSRTLRILLAISHQHKLRLVVQGIVLEPRHDVPLRIPTVGIPTVVFEPSALCMYTSYGNSSSTSPLSLWGHYGCVRELLAFTMRNHNRASHVRRIVRS